MVSSNAETPDEYIASLPEDRRATVAAVRDVIRSNLPEGFEEGMQYGMIGWYVPLERFPDTYNGQPSTGNPDAPIRSHVRSFPDAGWPSVC